MYLIHHAHSSLGLASGLLFGFLWEMATQKIKHQAHIKSCHYHHSLLGLAIFLLIPQFLTDLNKALFIAGFGFGVILQHSIKEGLIFITKD